MRITIMMHEFVKTVRNVVSIDLDYELGNDKYIFIKSEHGSLIMRCAGIDVIQIDNEDTKNE